VATLRLFANLREIAGTNRVELDATSVGDALDEAVSRYGDEFASSLAAAQVWVNGDQADRGTAVAGSDEIAVIPPVSGGATVLDESTDMIRAILTAALWVTVLVANLISVEALAFAAVGTAIAWLWDIGDTFALRRHAFQIIPAMTAATAGATAAYRWGETGLAGGLAVGIMFTLAWAVLDKTNRSVEALATTTLLAAVAALSTGSMVIVGLRSAAEVAAFLGIVGVAAIAAWVGRRFGGASLDPNLAILLATLAAGIGAGLVAETLDLVVMLLAAAVTAGGLIAGRSLGSLVRNGDVLHTVRAPGLLTMLDPAMVGISMWWVSLLLFSAVTSS
jgi:MoaD family protein